MAGMSLEGNERQETLDHCALRGLLSKPWSILFWSLNGRHKNCQIRLVAIAVQFTLLARYKPRLLQNPPPPKKKWFHEHFVTDSSTWVFYSPQVIKSAKKRKPWFQVIASNTAQFNLCKTKAFYFELPCSDGLWWGPRFQIMMPDCDNKQMPF